MDTIIFGNGNLGRAIAGALVARGDPAPTVLGRPGPGGHLPSALPMADVAIDASTGDAVLANVGAAIDAGCRRFVIATTAWEASATDVASLLHDRRAAAVAAPNLSLGVALFARLVERAVDLFGSFDDVDPYLLEWHRRAKADRPSGTARDLARRIIAAHPRKRRIADARSGEPPLSDELEVAVIRAGASPGMHLVGFDAPGETIELRLTARDRSAYAAGALAAVDWLLADPRAPGIHPFDEVVDARLASHAGSEPVRQLAVAAG